MAEEQKINDPILEKMKKDPFGSMLLKAIGKKHECTPSEKIVELAKERDMVYDFIKEKEDELTARKEAKDVDSVSFIEADIKLLTDRKTLLTNRIKDLLDKT